MSSVGSAFDFGMMVIPGMDLCEQGPEMLYIAVAEIEVDRAIPTVSINNTLNPLSHHISRCEPLKLRFNMGVAEGQPFDIYDARLVVNLHGNYYYKDGSAVINLRDEGGSALVNFEPVTGGDTLIWNLGDLRGLAGGGYVEIEVEKTLRGDIQPWSMPHCSATITAARLLTATVLVRPMARIRRLPPSPPLRQRQRLLLAHALQRSLGNALCHPGRLLQRWLPLRASHAINSGSAISTIFGFPRGWDTWSRHGFPAFLEAHVTGVSGQTSAVIERSTPSRRWNMAMARDTLWPSSFNPWH